MSRLDEIENRLQGLYGHRDPEVAHVAADDLMRAALLEMAADTRPEAERAQQALRIIKAFDDLPKWCA